MGFHRSDFFHPDLESACRYSATHNTLRLASECVILEHFVPSIWFWLHIAGVLLVKNTRVLVKLLEVTRRFVDVKKQPSRCIGFAAFVVITVAFIIGGVLLLL